MSNIWEVYKDIDIHANVKYTIHFTFPYKEEKSRVFH